MVVSSAVFLRSPSRLRELGPRLGAAACLLACAVSASALERVTLRNGFSYDCTHRETLSGGHVRLFLPDTGDGYIELPASSIVSIEPVAQPAAPKSASTGASADVPTLLARAGAQHDIDVDLLASIVHAESNGRARAVSRTGAEGLMQLMPRTAHQLGVADAFRPADNIAGGTAYLDSLLTRYSDNLALALAAYNAGPAAVARYHGVPPFRETRAYVTRVMNEFKRRKLAAERSASRPSEQEPEPASGPALASR